MAGQLAKNATLVDRFDRHVKYVRMSITDRYDFRCVYCMDEEMTFMPREQLLSLDEIVDLVRFAVKYDLDISYIEEMPLEHVTYERGESSCSSDEVKAALDAEFDLIPSTAITDCPSRYYQLAGTNNKVGLISPYNHNFCEPCNRGRVTTQGRLLLCLGQEHSVDILAVVHGYPSDVTRLKQAIIDSMDTKPKGHEINVQAPQSVIFRHMNVTGE